MPDPKDKYSDTKLDPSDADFQEIVSQPDMQALDDQGDAIARDLEGREEEPSKPRRFFEHDYKDAAREAEADELAAADNQFGYQKDETKKLKVGFGGWSRRKKALVVGGSAGGVSGILALVFLLLPMKVPGLLTMVTDEAGQRIEQVTEKRAKLIIARAILTKFGSHTGIVITGEGAFKTLIASMRTANFEKRLAAKGITIDSTPDGVKLRVNGTLLENGKSLKTEADIIKALDGHPVSNKVVKTLVKEEIPAWRLFKRVKFAKWLRIKYGVPRFGLPNSDADTEEKRTKEIDKERVTRANTRLNNNFSGLVKCIMTGSCDGIDGKGEPSNTSQADAENTANDVNGYADESLKEVEKTGLKNLQRTALKILLEKIGTKAIPIIGWIDLVATIDHMVYTTANEDYIGKIAAFYKSQAYGAIYSEWAGYGSQIKLGQMNPEYIGELANELNGSEKAQFFQVSQGHPDKGTPIEVTVNNTEPSEVSKLFREFVDSPLGINYKILGHPFANIYYETFGGGGFLDWIAKVIAHFLDPIFSRLIDLIGLITPDKIEAVLKEKALATINQIGPYILKMFGLTIDEFEKGAKLFNNIFAGGVVSFNEYGKEMGLRKLTPLASYQQTQDIATERTEDRSQRSLASRLFSPDDTKSLTSQVAMAMPTTSSGAFSLVGDIVSSAPSKLLSTIIPRSSASNLTTYESLLKLQAYGATEEDLNQPLSKEFLNGEPCPDVKEGDYNSCKVDTEVAESMRCEFEPDIEECSDGDTSMDYNGVGGNVRAATFNMRGESHTRGSSNPAANYKNRMEKSIQVITENKFEIIGFQEFQTPQRDIFESRMGDKYHMTKRGDHHLTENPIAWDFNRFDKVEEGLIPGGMQYAGGQALDVPWVLLKDKASGLTLYFLNTHDPANVWGPAADERLHNARVAADFVRKLKDKKIPILYTGDFNSGYDVVRGGQAVGDDPQNLTYCVLTNNGLMDDAYDLWKGRPAKCPNPLENADRPHMAPGIDHIYLSPGLTVPKMFGIPASYTRNGSDHPTIFADITIPGMDGQGPIAGGWSWPVDKRWWVNDKADFLGPHIGHISDGCLSGTAWGEDNMGTHDKGAGIASDISHPPIGSHVYAMLGGTVTSTNLCGVNDGIAIKTLIGKDVVGIAYMHGINQQYKVGQTVEAGKYIMDLNEKGCSVSGSHVHIGIAYNGKYICPQDIFLAMGAGKNPDLEALTKKAAPTCGRL